MGLNFTPVTAAPPEAYMGWNIPPKTLFPEPAPRRAVTTAPSYERAAFEPARLQKVAAWAAAQVRIVKLDAIVVIGHSGLVMGGAVSLLSGVPVFAVRKKGEESLSHDGALVNGVAPFGAVQRWGFLDDFVSSGASLRWSMKQVFDSGLVQSPVPNVVLTYSGGGSRRVGSDWPAEIAPDWSGWPTHVNEKIPHIEYSESVT
jgi:hypothetical protein